MVMIKVMMTVIVRVIAAVMMRVIRVVVIIRYWKSVTQKMRAVISTLYLIWKFWKFQVDSSLTSFCSFFFL